MKIAVCVSGVPQPDINKNLLNLERNFPAADIYLGTWKQYENVLGDRPHWSFNEPKPHYHPYLDMPKHIMISDKMRTISDIYKKRTRAHERTRYQCLQMICHANMINSLPEKYDVIIRARFDTFTYVDAKFEKYVNDVYQNKTAIGFANLHEDRPMFNVDREINSTDPMQNDGAVSPHNVLQKHLFDSLIIHHGDCIDTENIFKLFEEQELCPSEFGWYQVLSQPYNDNHRCISGWANADKHVNQNFLMEVRDE